MSDAEQPAEGAEEGKKKKDKKKKEDGEGGGEEGSGGEEGGGDEKKSEEGDSISRSIMDYIMPAKEMVAKMTKRRRFVIISDCEDPEYLHQLEESFVHKADILDDEMYHFNLSGNLQRGRITRYLQRSTHNEEFPYIFIDGEYFQSLDVFLELAEKDKLHTKVHGFGRPFELQTARISYTAGNVSQAVSESVVEGVRSMAEKIGIREPDTRTEKEKEKDRRKKRAAKLKKEKEKEKAAKKARIKRKLWIKAKKKAIRLKLAAIGIKLPEEDKKAKARKKREKKKKQQEKAKAEKAKKLAKEKEAAEKGK